MQKCPSCDAVYGDDCRFCQRCGTRLGVFKVAAEVLVGLVQLLLLLPGLISAALVLLCLWWLVCVWYVPHMEPNSQDLANAGPARVSVEALLSSRLPDNAQLRLEQHGGFNLAIWVSQSDLESVPYPDRKSFIETVGRAWCEAPGLKSHHGTLPSVTVRDVRSGNELASYSCVFSHASVN